MSHKKSTPHSRLEVSLPEELRLQAELFLRRDLITGKIAHGEWSKYITRLVQKDLNDRAGAVDNPRLPRSF